MESEIRCNFCGETLESYQRVCPTCGKIQNSTNHFKQTNVYTTLQDVANAMISGEESFIATGEEMAYKSENYAAYIRAYFGAVSVICGLWVFLYYKGFFNVWFNLLFFMFVGLCCIYIHLTRKKHSLFFNLVAGNLLRMGPNSPLSAYSVKKDSDGNYVVKRTWISKNPILTKCITLLVALLLLLVILYFSLFY